MVTVACVVFGVFSYQLLPVELMPDITYPSLTVRTEYSGAAPEEVEENVTRPLEEALGVVSGLTRISSVSRAGLSDVTLEFTWETAMNQSWQEVTERLDTVFLPDDADKPLILRYDPSLDPVIRLALASSLEGDEGPEGLLRLRTFAEQELKRRLEQVEGVASIRVLGGLEEQVSVSLDEAALRRTGLSIQEVVRRIAAENVNLAGGDIKEGDTQYLVRTLGEFAGLAEIESLVIARVGGRELRLRDIGSVTSGWADRLVITRLGQEEAIEIEIQKEADANVVSMADAVRAALEGSGQEAGLRTLLPEGWRLELVSDRSTFIRGSVREVLMTAIVGGVLAVLVLYLFLGDLRITAVVSIAIPVSIAATFAPMNLAGLSMNIMSLGGLALGIGMLVDSGIVVVESIARCREEGDELVDAVVRGSSEVGTAVVASTLTTVAVFFPMVFVEGVAGQVFTDLALTVVFSLLASLMVSIFLVPALVAKVGVTKEDQGSPRLPLRERLRRVLRFRTLGPLSAEPPQGTWPRRLGMILLVLPLAVVLWIIAGRMTELPDVATVLLGALFGAFGLAVLVTNLVLRLRAGSIVGAFLLLIFDPVLLVLESVWLGAVGLLTLVILLAWGLLRVLGAILGVLLIPLAWLQRTLYGALSRGYPRLIRAALKQRAAVLALAALLIVLTGWGATRLDTSLIPEVHQGEFDLELSLPVGTPVEETLREVVPLERWAAADPRLDRVMLKVGADPEADSGPEEGEHTARLSMHVAPAPKPESLPGRIAFLANRAWASVAHAGAGGQAAVREEEVIEDLRAYLSTLPDLEAKVTRPVLFSFRTPIEIEIEAYDLGALRGIGESVRQELTSIPFLSDVKTTARVGSPEVQIAYDREALVRLGLDLREVAELVRTKVKGSSATEYRRRERRIDVVVRLGEADRATVRQLRNLVVNPGAAVPVPLSAVARVEVAAGPADIRRVGQRRVALVQANIASGGLGKARDAILEALSRVNWPPEVSWRLAGQVQEMERSSRSLWLALLLSIFLVYVVMASQFESLVQPLLIMITVPLALCGVVFVLLLMKISLSIVVFLGMIMLAGIVVNNAIVLVDYVGTLRKRGMATDEALVEAGSVRLRPIMMTTATTVLGLLPMALGLGDGSEIRTPMALTVIAGLVVSTLLTLVILPTAYAALDSLTGGSRDER